MEPFGDPARSQDRAATTVPEAGVRVGGARGRDAPDRATGAVGGRARKAPRDARLLATRPIGESGAGEAPQLGQTSPHPAALWTDGLRILWRRDWASQRQGGRVL